MQISAPEVMNIRDEPQYIHDLYGTKPGSYLSCKQCLTGQKTGGERVFALFRSLTGVGIVMARMPALPSISVSSTNAGEVDKSITALILDLKQRGLLEETLVVWGGEFGRTPMMENREGKNNPFKGRDHHTDAFTIWMAGGGIKKGYSHGETDEIGYSAMSGKVDAIRYTGDYS